MWRYHRPSAFKLHLWCSSRQSTSSPYPTAASSAEKLGPRSEAYCSLIIASSGPHIFCRQSSFYTYGPTRCFCRKSIVASIFESVVNHHITSCTLCTAPAITPERLWYPSILGQFLTIVRAWAIAWSPMGALMPKFDFSVLVGLEVTLTPDLINTPSKLLGASISLVRSRSE